MFATNRDRSRRIARRHFAKSLAALAVACTGSVIVASGASASTACVYGDFGISNTYQPCVRDEQVLLNDLRSAHLPGPNQLLATDGYYGIHTANDVSSFNYVYGVRTKYVGETTPETWGFVCVAAGEHGFRGAYWQAAGCPTFG
jgi:hypothetical protein